MKIKLGFIVLHLDYGGLEHIVNQLIIKLDKKEYEAIVFCLDHGGVFLEELKKLGIKYYILNRKPGPLDLKLIFNLTKLILKEKVSLIHSHSGCSFYSAVCSFLTRTPAVHTDHGRGQIREKNTRLLEDRLSSFIFKKYISVSKNLTNYLIEKVKLNPKKIQIIYNGVDHTIFRPMKSALKNVSLYNKDIVINKKDVVIFGVICRFDPIKNLLFLLQTFESLIKEGIKNIYLVLVGDGIQRPLLENYIKENNLAEHVLCTGFREDTIDLLNIFDIFILPSLSEGLSLSILEAMAVGLPIIASNVGDNAILVRDGLNGYICPSNDQECFKSKMKNLLVLEIRDRFGKMSRELCTNEFSLTKMVNEYQLLYQGIIKG